MSKHVIEAPPVSRAEQDPKLSCTDCLKGSCGFLVGSCFLSGLAVFAIILVVLFVVVCIILFILLICWFVGPKFILSLIHPPGLLPTCTIDNASLTQFTLSPTNQLQYGLTVAMTMHNPNKDLDITYRKVKSLALFDDQRFGYGELKRFDQGPNSSAQLTPTFQGQQVMYGDTATASFQSQQASSVFGVVVKLNTMIWIQVVSSIRFPWRKAKITCNLSLAAPGNASAPAFKPTVCQVS